MLELYYWPTPNGHKITIFLEEANLPYQIKAINIGKGEQFSPEFLQISPNNKIPALVDLEPKDKSAPLTLFESGAILLYLAEKSGQFMAHSLHQRYETLQWLFWQVAGLGPMAGQNHHFSQYADAKIPYAIERYVNETSRLYAVLNKQLSDREFIAKEYSIADMACYPWIVPFEKQQQNLADFPHLKRWFETISQRPAVQKAYKLGQNINSKPTVNEDSKKFLFGQDAKTIK